jgi:hypothetical protein
MIMRIRKQCIIRNAKTHDCVCLMTYQKAIRHNNDHDFCDMYSYDNQYFSVVFSRVSHSHHHICMSSHWSILLSSHTNQRRQYDAIENRKITTTKKSTWLFLLYNLPSWIFKKQWKSLWLWRVPCLICTEWRLLNGCKSTFFFLLSFFLRMCVLFFYQQIVVKRND